MGTAICYFSSGDKIEQLFPKITIKIMSYLKKSFTNIGYNQYTKQNLFVDNSNETRDRNLRRRTGKFRYCLQSLH